MPDKEAVDLTARDARRHGDAKATAAGVDTQRQTTCPLVLDDAQRQGAAGDDMLAFRRRNRARFRQGAEEAEGHRKAD